MKKFVLSLFIVVLLLSGCSIQNTSPFSYHQFRVDLSQESLGEASSLTFTINSSYPDFPTTAPIYKVTRPEITREYVKQLGTKFGLTGKVLETDEEFAINDSDSDRSLEIYKATGTIIFNWDSHLYPLPGEPFTLPSDEEAMKITQNILNEKGLLPEGDIASKVYGRIGDGGSVGHLLINFTHLVPLAGTGNKRHVRIGNNGEVVQVWINPINPSLLPVLETVPIKPVEQAFEEMKANKYYFISLGGAKEIQIDDIYLAYWLEPIDVGQDHVSPVYVFKGKCIDADGKVMTDDIFGQELFTGYANAIY